MASASVVDAMLWDLVRISTSLELMVFDASGVSDGAKLIRKVPVEYFRLALSVAVHRVPDVARFGDYAAGGCAGLDAIFAHNLADAKRFAFTADPGPINCRVRYFYFLCFIDSDLHVVTR